MEHRLQSAGLLALFIAAASCSATGASGGERPKADAGEHQTDIDDNPLGNGEGGKNPGGDEFPGEMPGGGGGNVCAGEVSEAQPTTLSMLIMFDQSSSMKGARWNDVVNAVKGFVQAPEAAGIQVALSYFSLTKPCTQNSDCAFSALGGCALETGYCKFDDYCEASDYETPEVPFEAIPAVAPKIIASLDKHKPLYNTTTTPALQGAINHAKARATSHPDEKVVVVFATDGLPDSVKCGSGNMTDVANIAKNGLNDAPSIPTYVIAVGPNLGPLNNVAASGGTNKAYLVSGSGGTQQQFLQAMNDIRQGAALPCEYQIPPPKQGQLDYNQVNVLFTPHGGTGSAIGQVPAGAQCGAGGGWYYDNALAPTKIHLCPATCSEVNAGQGGKVEIQLGCKTIIR